MVIGAVWCSSLLARAHARTFRSIKIKHGLDPHFEIKWTKVSESKIDFYLEILEQFFTNQDIHFRALLITDKRLLDHKAHNQNHDQWYYKMFFDMLKFIIGPKAKYRIYIDIKDDWGGSKVDHLHEVLSNNMYDFSRTIVERMQIMRSHESELLQVADLLIGAVSYAAREKDENRGKIRLVDFIRKQTGYSLQKSTLVREEKFNILRWSPREMK
jgi:hypothetical protein